MGYARLVERQAFVDNHPQWGNLDQRGTLCQSIPEEGSEGKCNGDNHCSFALRGGAHQLVRSFSIFCSDFVTKILDFLRKLKYNHIRKISKKGKKRTGTKFTFVKKRTVPKFPNL